MRPLYSCIDCGLPVSRVGVARCGPCAATEREARRKVTRIAVRRDDTPARYRLGACPLDGLAIEGHPRCRGCTALCGPAHMQRMDRDGCCDACWRHFDRVALGRVAWAEAS